MNRNRSRGLTLYIIFLLAAALAHSQAPAKVNRITFDGTIGQSKVGMTLLVSPAGTITGGHYFYAKYLKDIPLKAGTQGTGIILYEPEGGQFALRFRGNGSEAGQPLNFRNSIGMEGRWMKGASSYPVTLQMNGAREISTGARWYEDVTAESDAAFETRVQSFYNAVLSGDRATAARYVDFPLRVNRAGKSHTIRSAAELSSQWNQIFTPACLDAFRNAMPHDMFVRNGQAMLGNGVAWFGPKGVQSINVP